MHTETCRFYFPSFFRIVFICMCNFHHFSFSCICYYLSLIWLLEFWILYFLFCISLRLPSACRMIALMIFIVIQYIMYWHIAVFFCLLTRACSIKWLFYYRSATVINISYPGISEEIRRAAIFKMRGGGEVGKSALLNKTGDSCWTRIPRISSTLHKKCSVYIIKFVKKVSYSSV